MDIPSAIISEITRNLIAWLVNSWMPEGYKHFSKTKPMKLEHFNPALEWWDNRVEIEEDGFPKAKKYTKDELINDFGCNLDLCGYPHEEEEILDPMDLINQYQEKRLTPSYKHEIRLDETRYERLLMLSSEKERREYVNNEIVNAATRKKLTAYGSRNPENIVKAKEILRKCTENPKILNNLCDMHPEDISDALKFFDVICIQ